MFSQVFGKFSKKVYGAKLKKLFEKVPLSFLELATLFELVISLFFRGTMGLFHRICLSQWLETSKTRSCEICKFTFEVKRYDFEDFWWAFIDVSI